MNGALAKKRVAPRPRGMTHGLLDFFVAVLCLWAAYFHTPVGSILRQTGAWFFQAGTRAAPVLSYFRTSPEGGTSWAGRALPPAPAALRIPGSAHGPGVGMAVPVDDALGLALGVILENLGEAHAPFAVAEAQRAGVPPAALLHAASAAAVVARVLKPLSARLGSDEAAVLALFVAEDVVRFAVDRTRAEGAPLTVAALEHNLPPEELPSAGHAAAALALATAYALRWPLSESAPLTSPFGWREHPVLGEMKLHAGVDLSVPVGTEVHAAGGGEVRRASEDALNGKILVVDHGHGVSTAYCHNSVLLLKVGEEVRVGQVIARSGASGRVTGPHLHYQLELSDVPVDPLRFRRAVINVGGTATALERAHAQVRARVLDRHRVEVHFEGLAPHAPLEVLLSPMNAAWPGGCARAGRRKAQASAKGEGRVELVLAASGRCSLLCSAGARAFQVIAQLGGAPSVRSEPLPCLH